ncbi:TPA: DUF4062 domain-containing protein [Yersinia enterocolitica]|uniref:DUF4062 domain-containing protein n=1 Tax=Yersinia enterocolitica TaxID=630 RepID=UPI002962B161|nr:DUF4062 domain-containing protein [Yersinia enterocolitica]HEF7269695.1 DUF4062 domain-containing protein [Yersinia enterocolitica]
MRKRLQVFVSSTFNDLKDERQAAVSAILKTGHIPAGMELFTAGDRSQWETIKNWIDESDVYMLILGGRYGSIESESGISYTELEYNYALETNKPLFSVVINDHALESKVKDFGSDVLEKNNPKEWKLFREKVLSNMSSFYDDTKDIKLCVLESLPEIARSRDLSGWISGSEVPDTKGLVDEISRLLQENTALKTECEKLTLQINEVRNEKDSSNNELHEILENTKIDVPAGLWKLTDSKKLSLLYLFLFLKKRLINGVTNQPGGSDEVKFMYFTICPLLQIHGLVLNEQVTSARHRRYTTTSIGLSFLAYEDKIKVLKDKL